MKKLFTLIFLLTLAGVIRAQNVFQKYYGDVTDCMARAIIPTFDGGFLAAGIKMDGIPGADNDVFLIKTDASGDTVWTRNFGGTLNDFCNSIIQTSDSGYVAAGNTVSFGNGIYLVKVSAAGNLLWSKVIGTSHYDNAFSVIETPDGGLAITGTYYNGSVSQMCLIKTNAGGIPLWTKLYGGFTGYNVKNTNDGGFILSGENNIYIYLIKTDSLGNVTWEKTYQNPYGSDCHAIQQTTDGGYMLGGSTVNFGEKIFLAKADSNGTILWSKYYGTSYCWGSAAQQTSDGGFMIAGRIDTASMLDYDMYLLKTDSAGNPQWGKMYIADYSLAYDASQTSDGGYILGGFRNNNFMQMGPASLYLIKTDSLGNSCENVDYIAAATSFTLTLIPSGITSGPDTFPATTPLTITESGASIITDICIGAGIDAIIKNTSSLQIFPNPSDGNFSLVSESMILNGEVEIVSMLGKTVYRSSLSNESSKEIHLNHAIPGIYFVTVFDGNKYHVMKLVIERI